MRLFRAIIAVGVPNFATADRFSHQEYFLLQQTLFCRDLKIHYVKFLKTGILHGHLQRTDDCKKKTAGLLPAVFVLYIAQIFFERYRRIPGSLQPLVRNGIRGHLPISTGRKRYRTDLCSIRHGISFELLTEKTA